MTVNEVIDMLEKLSPPAAACSWDNVGLMAGDRNADVSRVLVTLDVDENAIQKAVLNGADMIISHHPLIFGGINSVTSDTLTGKRIISLIRNNITCFSMHTNFDICGSMGKVAAATLGLKDAKTLEVTDTEGNGLGMVSDIDEAEVMTAAQWAERVKKCFDIPTVKVFGSLDKNVYRIAIYPGSGSSSIPIALKNNADVLVTGDIGHHAGIDAAAQGLTVIDAGHYGIEHVFIRFIAEYIKEKFPALDVIETDIKNPFEVI